MAIPINADLPVVYRVPSLFAIHGFTDRLIHKPSPVQARHLERAMVRVRTWRGYA